MATDSMIAGLFMTPELYQQQQLNEQMARNAQLAQLTPDQQVSAGLRTAGWQLGQGLGGLMGAQDPQLTAIRQQQQLLTGVDFTNAKALAEAAKKATELGRPDIAQQLAQQAIMIQAKIDEKQATREQQQAQFEASLAQRKDLADQANQTKDRKSTRLNSSH